MTRTMYDSDNAADIPGDATLIAAYVDGSRTGHVYGDVMARIANGELGASTKVVKLSAVGNVDGEVIDVEPGDTWPPANAVDWINRQRARGGDPTVYCGRANWPTVIAAFDAAGIAQPHYWVAHYIGPHLCDDTCYPSSVGGRVADATQYGGDVPGHYDISIVSDTAALLGGSSAGSSTESGSELHLDDVDDKETTGMKITRFEVAGDPTGERNGDVYVRGFTGIAYVDGEIDADFEARGFYGERLEMNPREIDLLIDLEGIVRNKGAVIGDNRYSRNEVVARLDGNNGALNGRLDGIVAALTSLIIAAGQPHTGDDSTPGAVVTGIDPDVLKAAEAALEEELTVAVENFKAKTTVAAAA